MYSYGLSCYFLGLGLGIIVGNSHQKNTNIKTIISKCSIYNEYKNTQLDYRYNK
jgi:hypothetical protein